MEYITTLPSFDTGTFVVELDGKKMQSLRSFYPRVAAGLHFADYFGKNLDALLDALCDLSSLPPGYQSVCLVIKNAAYFLAKEKKEKRESALQTIQDATIAENRYDNYGFQFLMLQQV